MNDFGKMNETYESMFGDTKPSRSAVQVARLPRDVLVEIEAIALTYFIFILTLYYFPATVIVKLADVLFLINSISLSAKSLTRSG